MSRSTSFVMCCKWSVYSNFLSLASAKVVGPWNILCKRVSLIHLWLNVIVQLEFELEVLPKIYLQGINVSPLAMESAKAKVERKIRMYSKNIHNFFCSTLAVTLFSLRSHECKNLNESSLDFDACFAPVNLISSRRINNNFTYDEPVDAPLDSDNLSERTIFTYPDS